MGGFGGPGMGMSMGPTGMGTSNSPMPPVNGANSMGSSMGFTPTPKPAYGDAYPLGPGQSGGMGPLPGGGGGMQMQNAGQPTPALSGTGQSPQVKQPGLFAAPSSQPPNAAVNDSGMAGSTGGPLPPVSTGQQNRMTVHNPTGMGATQASQMAAAQRPTPANQPTRRVGMMPPTPSNIPGAPK
jgi:hypothetical protein